MKTNLTEKVRCKVVENILDGTFSPGEKIPTEREMVTITETSRVTVRRAYDQLEKAKIITRIHGAGTRVATTFRGNQDTISHIALMTTLRDPFALDFVEAAEQAVTENDSLFVLALTNGSESETTVALRLAAAGIKNLIIWGSSTEIDQDAFKRLRILGVNIVFFDRIIPSSFADFVGLDNHHAVQVIIDDAQKKQCDNFIFVNFSGISFDSNRERQEKFAELCNQHKFNCREITLPYKNTDQKTIRQLYQEQLAGKLNAKSAIVCVNDSVALKIADCAEQQLIYSIDGRDEAINRGIISYTQPITEMAKATVAALINQQKKGNSWQASSRRFKGKLSLK